MAFKLSKLNFSTREFPLGAIAGHVVKGSELMHNPALVAKLVGAELMMEMIAMRERKFIPTSCLLERQESILLCATYLNEFRLKILLSSYSNLYVALKKG